MSAENTLVVVAPVKTCRKCQAEFSGRGCPECAKRRHIAWSERNPGKASLRAILWNKTHKEERKLVLAKWNSENSEKIRISKARWRDANPEKNAEINSARKARYVDELSDSYVAAKLGFRAEKVPKELIELKRIHLKILRQLKEAK